MRFLGVRVDTQRAYELRKELIGQEHLLLQQVQKETGEEVQIWAARSIEKVFQKLNLSYERTAKSGEPSFTKNFLSNHEHPIIQKIAEARKINKVNTTFIDTILKHEHKGRIYAEINQIRSDDGGTITGRFSYNNPNLQQIPARDKVLGPMIRSLFIPEEGCRWGCFDYSQQEPRLVAHYALRYGLPSVNTIADSYDTDPSTDFHKIVAEMAEIPRSQAKVINLGLFYGMGKARFPKYEPILRGADWGKYIPAEDEERMKDLQEMGPYLKDEEDEIIKDKDGNPKKNYWHNNPTRRAFTYKALNKLIQGSAADMTKKAMLELHKEGITPHIQVHDELDISVINDLEAAKIKDVMENAVDLKIPNKVDYESGPNWGSIK
jgi:DNA polymerase I-like protein with 3'-5' exonuclease and polymerase domains